MAYETKVLLMSLARHALLARSKRMYKVIAEMANVEGVILKTYDEAEAEQDLEDDVE
jgi:hypothetical protein